MLFLLRKGSQFCACKFFLRIHSASKLILPLVLNYRYDMFWTERCLSQDFNIRNPLAISKDLGQRTRKDYRDVKTESEDIESYIAGKN